MYIERERARESEIHTYIHMHTYTYTHTCIGGGAVLLPALERGAGQGALPSRCLLHWHGSLVRDAQVSFGCI